MPLSLPLDVTIAIFHGDQKSNRLEFRKPRSQLADDLSLVGVVAGQANMTKCELLQWQNEFLSQVYPLAQKAIHLERDGIAEPTALLEVDRAEIA